MTDDDKALVQELYSGPVLDRLAGGIITKAADRIEALSAENERLRDLLNRVAEETDHDCETMWITDIIRAALGETK